MDNRPAARCQGCRAGHDVDTGRGNQSGFSLVKKSVVAIAVLAIVLVPTIRLVLFGQQDGKFRTNPRRGLGSSDAGPRDAGGTAAAGIMPTTTTRQVTVIAGVGRLTVVVNFRGYQFWYFD